MLGPSESVQNNPKRKTIDHVKCKEECVSRAEWAASANKVFACYECNQYRNSKFRAEHGPTPITGWWISTRQAKKNHARKLRRPLITKTDEIANVDSKTPDYWSRW